MKRKRDYQNKDFRNPYFGQKKKSKIPKRFKFYFIIFVVFLVGGLEWLNTSDYFKITNIEISGNEDVREQDIKDVILEQLEKKRWFFFDQNNIIFFSTSMAEKKLSEEFNFSELDINKRYHQTIKVEVEEYDFSSIWISGDDKYYIHLDGRAIRKMSINDIIINEKKGDTFVIRSEISSGKYPVIYDQSNKPVTLGQKVTSQDVIFFVVGVTEKLNEIADFDISYYNILGPDFDEITLMTNEGWKIQFKVEILFEKQINLLLSILQEKIKDRSKLEYIDLRFGDKIFYK